MLINLSNHPSEKWSAEQLEAARKQFGEIVDLAFPAVDPDGDEAYISELAESFTQKVLDLAGDASCVVVHLMGEMTLTYALVQQLRSQHIECVSRTTQRIVNTRPDGVKEAVFRFVRFRRYA